MPADAALIAAIARAAAAAERRRLSSTERTAELAEALRAARGAGATHAQLAAAVGLSAAAVRNLLRHGATYWQPAAAGRATPA